MGYINCALLPYTDTDTFVGDNSGYICVCSVQILFVSAVDWFY